MSTLISDWRLITRKCRPSVVWGATWGRLDVTRCKKYQFSVKETWLENRRDLRDKEKEQWVENESTIRRSNRARNCAAPEGDIIPFLMPTKCDSSESLSFVCIHQTFLLLNSFIFSKPWYKFSHKRASYYFEYSGKNWHEANKSCHAFPVKSTLLQGIRSSEEYSVFKFLLRWLHIRSNEVSSWWMNLFQDGDSLKWLTSPEESPTFVDWDKDTNFYMNRSAGIVMDTYLRSWSLRDLSTKQGFICEIEDFKESHDTAVYVEDRTRGQEVGSGGAYEVDLQCVPSGWFVWESITWFKDGAAIYDETFSQRLHLVLITPFTMEYVSEFQGYYYCSVDVERPSKLIFSPKLLVKFPGCASFYLFDSINMVLFLRCTVELCSWGLGAFGPQCTGVGLFSAGPLYLTTCLGRLDQCEYSDLNCRQDDRSEERSSSISR
ncbi:hypothetical protein AVEN_267075-1 [Araneus ventricosus]|uniref:Ig-like domain-containing protein n=1 Tax=Araneus ventricosus TaxID=182803 RepID=A0A4Y2IPX5_ARAVE|nr:hypothetical protein AVEN_267075-1 [Araneus ventricosus]